MRKARKLFVLALALAAVLVFAAACQNDTPPETTTGAVTPTAEVPSVPTESSTPAQPDTPTPEPPTTETPAPDTPTVQPSTPTVTPTPEKVTITLDPNGGTMDGATSFGLDAEGYVDGDIATPVKEGYKFLGWFTEKEGGEEVTVFVEIFTESKTFYAHWAKSYIVEFDANGGTLTGSASVEVVEGSKIKSVPVAAKEGFDFQGWYTAAEGGEKVDVVNYTVNANVKFYAQYGGYTMRLWNLKNTEGTALIGYRIEAEDAKVIGEPNQEREGTGTERFIEVDQQYASNKKSLGYLGVDGNQIVFTFYAESAGKGELAVRMSSNAMQFDMSAGFTIWVDDQVVGNDVFTATFNGKNVPFESATLRGAGIENPMVWNMYFDPVSFGELDIQQGVNTLVITGVGTTFPNTDCLDIITKLTLKSANGDAATGELKREADAGTVTPGDEVAYEKDVAAKLVIGAYDGGPAVDKVVLTFADNIPASAVEGKPLTVGWNNQKMGGNTDKIYLSDENGKEITGNSSKYVTIEYKPTYSGYGFGQNLSPFNYANSYNSWKDVSIVKLTMTNFTVGSKTYTKFTGKLNASYYVPSLDKWDITKSHTKGDVTIKYGEFIPEVPEGEKRPLIIWLHGMGEGNAIAGNDPSINLLGNKVTPLAENPIQSYFDGAFVLAPQAPTYWMDTIAAGGNIQGAYAENSQSKYFEALEELLRTYVANNPKIDATRVYVGGCSNGGWCTLEVVARMGNFFAGAYPVCAPYARAHFTDEMFANLTKVPMWIVASNDDTTVNNNGDSNQAINVDGIAHSKRLYIDLLEAGCTNVHFSLFPNVTADGVKYMGHFSWIYVFRDEVKNVQAQTGSGEGGKFTKDDYNTGSTLTAKYGDKDVNMWQWLSTFRNDGTRLDPRDAVLPIDPVDPGTAGMPVNPIDGGYRIEAEDADVEGVPVPSWWAWVHGDEPFTVVETDKPNASGTKAIGSLNSAGATVKFVFSAADAGEATLKLFLASNAGQGTADTEFSPAIFTVTLNGEALNFAAQTVHGGTTYSDKFEAVILGTANLKKGENTVIITVVDATNIGNMDCLDVLTAVKLTAAGSSSGSEEDPPVGGDAVELKEGDTVVLEAEDADVKNVPTPSWWAWVHGDEPFTVVEENKPNASGTKAIGSLNSEGAEIVFVLNAKNAGKARLELFMASNAGQGTADTEFSPAIFTAAFNGAALNFAAQTVHGGTTYSDKFEAVVLGEVDIKAGENKLVITVVDAANIGNMDCLKIVVLSAEAGGDTPAGKVKEIDGGYRFEAEDAGVDGVPAPMWWSWVHGDEPFTVVETDKPNASGTKAIGSLNSAGATIKFVFSAADAGEATLKLFLASNAGQGTEDTEFSPAIFTVTVNGQEVSFAPQTVHGGTTYSDKFEPVVLGTVNLKKGENTVIVTVVDATNIGNMDCLDIQTSVKVS